MSFVIQLVLRLFFFLLIVFLAPFFVMAIALGAGWLLIVIWAVAAITVLTIPW